ncbi:MAG: inositol monophosphatase, partial [Bacteroidetes bacterium]
MQLDVICRKAADGIRAIGQWQLAEQHKVRATDVELKDHNSLVSYVDRESERRLAEHLQRLWPGCGFLTEEETVDQRACDVRWIIDPLDGTT